MMRERWLAWSVAAATVALAAGGFVLSFSALRELAVASGIPVGLAPVWPLIVDGFIVVATLAAFALRRRGWRTTWYPWLALLVFSVLSISGNALHVTTVPVSVPVWLAVVVSSVPAVALLLASHLLVVMLAAPRPAPAAAVLSAGGERPPHPAPAIEPGELQGEVEAPAVVSASEEAAQSDEAAPAGVGAGVGVGSAGLAAVPAVEAGETPTSGGEDVPSFVRALIEWAEEHGGPVTPQVAAEVCGKSRRTGRRYVAELRQVRPDLVEAAA